MENCKLTKKERKQIDTEADKVKADDLYNHLHRVGSDFTKSDIENALVDLLDPLTFRKVVAVFKIATDD
jgi:hypothetical protein